MSLDANTFNPGAMEEKVKYLQRDITEMKAKHEDNGKKLDAVLLKLSELTGGFGFITDVFKEMSSKLEGHQNIIVTLQGEVGSIRDIIKNNETHATAITTLQSEMGTMKDKNKQNFQWVILIAGALIAQVAALIFGVFK